VASSSRVCGGIEHPQRYRPLTDLDKNRIHDSALDVLEAVGIGNCLPSTIDYLTRIGCVLQPNGRITFPRALVEDYIPRINRDFLLAGREPHYDMHMHGSRVWCGTAGAMVNMVDPRTGVYRDTTLADLYDCARLVDTLDNIHFFQRTVVPRELPDAFEMDFNTCYASLAGTMKHVGTSWGGTAQLEASIELMHMLAGGEKKWRERPFVSMSCCFTVSPLKWAPDSCLCLEVGARAGMPIMLVSLGQAGATGPAALAGNVVMILAELLAGVIYVEAVAPGTPVILGFWPFVCDLRTGAMCCGSAEQALLTAACGQMSRHYALISGIPAGISDSKMPDAQSGYEKALNHVCTLNSGANLMYEAGGAVASLMGFSLESLTMDNDSVGAALRTVHGIEISDDALSVELIREVCLEGPGHFLSSTQTMARMESDFFYPRLNDRMSLGEWEEKCRKTALDRAIDYVDVTLAQHYPNCIPREIDEAVRAKYPVRLPRERMAPNPDWPRAGAARTEGNR